MIVFLFGSMPRWRPKPGGKESFVDGWACSGRNTHWQWGSCFTFHYSDKYGNEFFQRNSLPVYKIPFLLSAVPQVFSAYQNEKEKVALAGRHMLILPFTSDISPVQSGSKEYNIIIFMDECLRSLTLIDV